MAYVVLKCGSAARGDVNKYSDEDFVCIHDEQRVPVERLKSQYPNISLLSLESVHHMKKVGSLFLTHLDIDGRIVEGKPSLAVPIAGFRPNARGLEMSFNSSSNFIAGIEWFPSSHEGNLWLLDVLYVSFRNILYCVNALHSSYQFGLMSAMESYGLNDQEMETMLLIRHGKYAFRSMSGSFRDVDAVDIKWLTSLATRLTKIWVGLRKDGTTNWERNWKYDYWDERLIESAIINYEIQDNGFRVQLRDHNYNRRILPEAVRRYVSDAKKGSPDALTSVDDLWR